MRSHRITRTCPTCGTLFETIPSRIASGRGVYCSRACPPYTKPLSQRFWLNVKKTSGCWEWTGKCFPNGYGMIVDNWRCLLTHRVSWTIHNGPIADGLAVCHRCDNRRCVRPDHLFLGTLTDNNRDMIAKGRNTRGERQHMAILSESDVRAIRALAESKTMRHIDIANNYGVSRQTIGDIVTRKHWKHVY